MQLHRRHLRMSVAVIAATAMVALAPAANAASGPDPVGKLKDTVEKTTKPLTDATESARQEAESAEKSASEAGVPTSPDASAKTVTPPAPTSDDDSPGHETENPTPPDHAAGDVADADLGDADVADLGNNDATVDDDDSSSADSTVLALGGNEVLGSHASSDGKNEDHAGDPLAPLCEGSDGALCLRVLYSDAYASNDGSTSQSESQSGVLDACVGGSNTDPRGECDGAVDAGAGQSSGKIQRDLASGRTTASSDSSVANACVGKDAATGTCAVGAGAVESEGQADSGNSPGSALRSSSLLNLMLNNDQVVDVSDPAGVAIPPGCTDPALLCAFLNQGESYIGDGVAGHAQEALHLDVLKGTPIAVLAEGSRTETLVHNDGGNTDNPDDPGDDNGDDNGPGDDNGDDSDDAGPGNNGADNGDDNGGETQQASTSSNSILPDTGGPTTALLALGLLTVATGAFLTARHRATH